MSKPNTKKPKKKRTKAPKKPKAKEAETRNGKMIQDLMVSNSVKGTYKDFVVFAGNRLIEWEGSYDAYTPTGESLGFEGVVLMHKSKLHEHIGEELASKWWVEGVGRTTK